MSGKEKGYKFGKLVTADGNKRLPGGTGTDFKVDLGINLQKVKSISINSITFPNNAWNINDTGGGTNNTFSINVNGTITDYEVVGGFYTTTTLMSAVEAAVQATLTGLGQGQTFTLAQDPLTQLVTATYGAGTSGISTITMEDTSSTGIWEILGFPVNTFMNGIEITTTGTVASNLPSLGGLKEAYVCSNELAIGNLYQGGGGQLNVLLPVPITAPFGVSNVFECKVDSLCEITFPAPRNLQICDFYLTDRNGNKINLHGGNLVINMKFWWDRY